ncbi:MAG: N-formylglutamate amidohydrolase [Planctomycetota bacterium]
MVEPIWKIERGDGPLVAAAIHAGRGLRGEVGRIMALGDAERLREEDPFTDEWTVVNGTRVIGLRSRFEVDLNRPREKAVYLRPEDAWGLRVWTENPPPALVERSLAAYDAFYARMRELLAALGQRHGRFVVFDLHSYNHRREGPDGPPADADGHPQVNVGTGSLDRRRWGALVDRFVGDLRGFDFPGGGLDVRENVKFLGGNFPRWVHATFSDSGCALAIEFKKFFMNEWTGEPDLAILSAITEALRSTVSGVHQELAGL